MDATLDTLPGEDEITVRVTTKRRKECGICGEPAHYRKTWLLPNARRNPSSKAYGKDDCTWCADDETYLCKEHQSDRTPPCEDMQECSTFPASSRFAHMFLYATEVEDATAELAALRARLDDDALADRHSTVAAYRAALREGLPEKEVEKP